MIVTFVIRESVMIAKTSFGQWLKQRRKALDLTREDLAGRVGCAAVTLYKIEVDERRPSKQIAELLAEHLNIVPAERAAFVNFARTELSESAIPWGTPFHPPTNLPAQPTVLIGRDEDVAAVCKQLHQPEVRLLTLIGPPGIGKTRLALEVATQMLEDFADGVFFVALAPITDTNLVLKSVVTTLDLQELGPQTPLERLKAFLRDKQTLLILDNFEQILAAAPQIAEFLAACPSLKMLVTSRAPLRIRPERQLPVSPLALPNLVHLPDVESVRHYSAVTLFLERAQAVKPDFSLTEDNAQTVAAICARLDGLPLAIELISARVKLLPPAALLERLFGRLLLQSDGLRDIEPRHRTLNAAIDWSYQLLSVEEQTLFWRLGVFVGGWTLEAAEAVCKKNVSLNILDGLASLLDKNLIKQVASSEGEPRFMMLETIREYASERLITSGEMNDLNRYHTNYFFMLAEEAENYTYGREQIRWFDQLEVEWDNLRAALIWSKDSETGLQLAAALGWFFRQRSHWKEGFDWLERILASNPDAPAFLRAKALNNAGKLAGLMGDGQQIRMLCSEALALARATNDRWNIAWALHHLAFHSIHDINESAAELEESLVLFRELDDPVGLSYALSQRAYHALDEKDYSYARLLLKEMEIRAREIDDKYLAAWMFTMLGRVAWSQDHDLRQAKVYYEQGQLLFREARSSEEANMLVSMLAGLELALGNVERSEMLNKEALILDRESTLNHPRIPFMLAGLATVAKVRGQFERSAKLLGAANSNWLVEFSNLHPEIVPYESDVADVRAQLGEIGFAEALAAGKTMTPEKAIVYALEDSASATEIALTAHAADQPLNDRELEILRLITDGMNSREIAQRLVLSVQTIRWYLKLIYDKLDVHSRSEAIARARELKLLE
jgi:predicted ATPase/DNA-binding CsgD family transcriptional regulator/DNA-binding XRE family transcriptional regulator